MKFLNIASIGLLYLTLVACPPKPVPPPDGPDPLSYAMARKVFEFVQGPSQHCNLIPLWEEGMDHDAMILKAQNTLNNGGMVSLGGFGGYIVLGFNKPVQNIADSTDFIVLGNVMPGSSEPGTIEVSEDINQNGLADDPWYAIKGAAHDHPNSIPNFQITYYRPNSLLAPVAWRDNIGRNGTLSHSGDTPSLYPLYLRADSLVLSGLRLPDNGINTGTEQAPFWVLSPYDYGYADNQANNHPKAQIDIDWAIDALGASVHLSRIHFIRIRTAIFQTCGWLGETTTEVAGARALRAD